MSKNRLWTIGLSAAIAMVLFLGYLLGVSPILSQASAADTQRANVAAANLTNESHITVLRTQFTKLDMLKSDLSNLSASIPSAIDMPVFLREINALTDVSNVVLGNVTTGAVIAYVPPASTVPAPATTPTPAATPAPGAGSAIAPTTAAVPAGPTSRLMVIPVQISVRGPYAAVMKFVGSLQLGGRLYLANSLSVGNTLENPGIFTGNLIGFVYGLPAATAIAATPATGAATTGDAAAAPTK